MLAYGALAVRVGERFEQKWLAGQPADDQTLQARDFAPTNSLYSIAGSAFKMGRVPFEARSVAILAGAALLPFVPAALFTMPLDVLLRRLGGFFL